MHVGKNLFIRVSNARRIRRVLSAYPRFYTSSAGYQAMMCWYDETLAALCAEVAVESLTIGTGFGRTHVLTAGAPDAPPLVLVHGINVNALGWAAQIRRLAGHFRLIVPDVPGFAGRSAPVRLPYAGDAYARWLADVLDALHIPRAGLAGSSGGGHFALKFAAHFPERTTAVGLVNPCGIGRYRFPLGIVRSQPLINLVGSLGHRRVSLELAERMVRANASPGQAPGSVGVMQSYLLLRYFRRHRPPDPIPTHELRRVTAPVLLLLGAHDPYFTAAAMVARSRQLFRHLTAEIIPDGGHDLHNDQADLVAARLLGFLSVPQ